MENVNEKFEAEKLEVSKISYLLIDDDEDIVEVMNDVISSNIDSQAVLAYNGPDGLKESQAKEFDFIITDYQLPSLNGIEFIEQIRTHEGPNKNTPIILLTGYHPDYDPRHKIWENVFFLQKPLTSKKLMFTIKCCIKLKNEE